MREMPGDSSQAPQRPPTPLSRRERERLLRAPSDGANGEPPSRRPILFVVAGVVLLVVAGMFGLAALSGDGDLAATDTGDAVDADDEGSASGDASGASDADDEGDGTGTDVTDDEPAEEQTATTAAASPTTAPPPSRPSTTVPSTAPPGPIGTPLQAVLQDGVVSVDGQVPSTGDAETVISVLEMVAGGGNVESALVVDPQSVAPSGISLAVGDGVSFAIGSTTIESAFLPILDRMAALMLDDPNISIVVEGHTDGTGDPVRNLALSQERAEVVVDYIADQGINRFRLEPRGRGSTEPVGDDSTAEGQAQNRRIEFVVVGLSLGSANS